MGEHRSPVRVPLDRADHCQAECTSDLAGAVRAARADQQQPHRMARQSGIAQGERPRPGRSDRGQIGVAHQHRHIGLVDQRHGRAFQPEPAGIHQHVLVTRGDIPQHPGQRFP